MALLCALWLFFAGFYLVGNTIRREHGDGRGEIATTRVGRHSVRQGPLEGLAVLFAILVVVSLTLDAAPVRQREAGEASAGLGASSALAARTRRSRSWPLAVAAEIHLRRGGCSSRRTSCSGSGS